MNKPEKVAILGLGAMGAYFASQFLWPPGRQGFGAVPRLAEQEYANFGLTETQPCCQMA